MSLPLPMIPRLRTVASLLLAMLSVLASLLPVQANDERDMLERREVREAGDRAGKERRDAQRLSEESAKRSRDESSAREADKTKTKTETRTDGGSVAKSEAKAETKSEAKGGDAGKSGGERGKDAAKRAEDQARDEARDGDDGDKDRDKDKNAEKARREAAGSNGRDGDRYRIERGVDGRERLRGEVLMIGRADAVARVRAEGYAVRSEQPLSVLGESVLRLEVRPGESVEQAVQHLQSIVPAASIAPNHVYRPSQGGALARPSTVAAANPALTPAAATVDLGQAIGILDTGVELATPQLAGAVLGVVAAWGFARWAHRRFEATGRAMPVFVPGLVLLLVVAFITLMLVVGRRALPWLLLQVSRTGSGELFTLAVIAAGQLIQRNLQPAFESGIAACMYHDRFHRHFLIPTPTRRG